MTKKIEIKDEIYQILDKRASESGFKTVDEYVNHVLKQVVEKLAEKSPEKDGYSKEEEDKVKERLKGLGYLD